jgi:indolepyruvate ferredoxin oxidoreductase
MQRWLDEDAGLKTGGFISGYRGSPLGAVDQQLWRARKTLDVHGIKFLPAINEDLAATAVLGSQQVENDPDRTVAGVFAMWYGKGPGVDRAGDALKHGNAYGSSRNGGVLVVAGDDHGCMSSSMPHQSDLALQAWSMPILNPANLGEVLEFGIYGWALSRFSGAWVGLKAISETIESSSTVDLDKVRLGFSAPDFIPPTHGLHYRWPDLPSLAIETRLAAKLDAVRAFAEANSVDVTITSAPRGEVGIVTCGKAHLDTLEALRRLGITLNDIESAGVRFYKVGLSFPIESRRMLAFVDGLKEILVIEEKAPVVERQLKELMYNLSTRPVIIGKTDLEGASVLSPLGELRPSRIMPTLANWLARHRPALDRRHLVTDFLDPELLSNAADTVKRVPYFCSGCPHNTSTKVPEGSRAQAGIGCHFMASWMPDRPTTGLIQMGGEGVDWAARSLFTKTPHVFQNLGDGTYFHSGYLAIRQSIAANANITYKILYNDAVAMTGGQPVDGQISVDAIARQVESEGAKKVVIVSDEPGKFKGQRTRFPAGVTFHDRLELDSVQRELRETEGVTVLIYDQTCAAEKRRRRKKGQYPDPSRRIFINAAVCEQCGDCGVQSNCMSIVPIETEFGRKRMIEQASCNKDYSCINGFCPSFVSVYGGKIRKYGGGIAGNDAKDFPSFGDMETGFPLGRDTGESRLPVGVHPPVENLREVGKEVFDRRVQELPQPAPHDWTGPFDMLVAGVGGTGVVTVGALITMAAHLENKSASVLDFMGFAQKGGMVLSYVRLADIPERLNQVRIDTQQADVILACDMVVAAAGDALQTAKKGRTKIIANTHEIPTAEFVQNPYADIRADGLLAKMRFAVGPDRVMTCDAQAVAERFLGDTIGANILLMGFCWQQGLIPLSHEAMMRAIELNGTAVDMNKTAFGLGRLAAEQPELLQRMLVQETTPQPKLNLADDVDALIEHRQRFLTEYQNSRYGARYRELVEKVRTAEQNVIAPGQGLPITRAVARVYARLLAYKDEYEVARLYTNGTFARALRAQFEGPLTIHFHMAPPLLSRPGKHGSNPRKMTFGPWMWPALKVLAKARILRGSVLDLFGYMLDRRMERQLAADYAETITALLPKINGSTSAKVQEIAELPDQIRGFGHVKASNLLRVKHREHALLQELGTQPRVSEAVRRVLDITAGVNGSMPAQPSASTA